LELIVTCIILFVTLATVADMLFHKEEKDGTTETETDVPAVADEAVKQSAA